MEGARQKGWELQGLAGDSIFIEHLWRSLKFEDICLEDDSGVPAFEQGMQEYFTVYNTWRLHQSPDPPSHQAHCPED